MADRLTIHDASFDDVERIVPKLRKADLLEAERAGIEVLESLRAAVIEGDYVAVVKDQHGEPVAIGGFDISLPTGSASVWLMATDALVRDHKREFLRKSAEAVEALNRLVPLLWNRVDCENAVHIRWLRWAGFHLSEPVPSPTGHPFHILTRRSANVPSDPRGSSDP